MPDERAVNRVGVMGIRFLKDLVLASRSLLRRGRRTAVITLALAPGLAAAGVALAVMYTVFLRPLPYPDADRLVYAGYQWGDAAPPGGAQVFFLHARERTRTIERMGLFLHRDVTLRLDGLAQRVPGAVTMSDALGLMVPKPAMGRLFSPEEDFEGAAPVVVVSYGFWRDALSEDPGVVGRSLSVNGVTRQIVGVLPEGFDFPGEDPRIVLPSELDPNLAWLLYFDWDGAVGRLAPGQSAEAATEELQQLMLRTPRDVAGADATSEDLRQYEIAAKVMPLKEWEAAGARPLLGALWGGALIALLLAVSAAANLFMMEVERRRPEQAVRRALGASRWSYISETLARAVALTFFVGALSALLSFVASRGVMGSETLHLPRVADGPLPDLAVLVTLLLACAQAPVLVSVALVSGNRRGRQTGNVVRTGPGRRRLPGAALAGQVAVSTVLVSGVLVVARSAWELAASPLGFDASRTVVFRLTLPETRYGSAPEAERFDQAVADALSSVSGVEDVAFGVGVPVAHEGWQTIWNVEDDPETSVQAPLYSYRHVSEGYLRALRVPLIAGRGFTRADNDDDRPVAVVNQAFAALYWANPRAALGRRIRMPDQPWYEIIGVAGNTADLGPGEEAPPMIYTSLVVPAEDRFHLRFPTFVVRGDLPMDDVVAAARAAVAEGDPSVAASGFTTMDRVVAESTAVVRLSFTVIGGAAGGALATVVIGLSGMVVLSGLSRRREIGIRKAVGGRERSLRWRLVARTALIPGAVGMLLGLGAVAAGIRVPAALAPGDFGIGGASVVAALGVSAVVAVAGYLASAVVMAVHPSEVLKGD